MDAGPSNQVNLEVSQVALALHKAAVPRPLDRGEGCAHQSACFRRIVSWLERQIETSVACLRVHLAVGAPETWAALCPAPRIRDTCRLVNVNGGSSHCDAGCTSRR